jgi:hypothetical protein
MVRLAIPHPGNPVVGGPSTSGKNFMNKTNHNQRRPAAGPGRIMISRHTTAEKLEIQ